ncbi:MAG: leucine-rich repeat domain-containing protein [Bacilli bacterium]
MIEAMDEEKKNPIPETSPEPKRAAHLPEEYAAPSKIEETQNPSQNAPKIKQPLDPKSKKGLIIACATIGVVASLMTAMLVVGFRAAKQGDNETGTTNNGNIIAGFFDANGHIINNGGSFSYDYQKSASPRSFLLSQITVKDAQAKTIILPYYTSSEESNNQQTYVTGSPDFVSGSNLFGTSGLLNVASIYAERYYAKIGAYAFSGLTSLTSFLMGNTSDIKAVSTFGAYAFSGDTALTKIALPNILTSLEEGVFENCSSLASLTLPGKLTSIGPKAFKGATALKELRYLNTKEDWQKITVGADWKEASLTSVTCTDGPLTLA